MATRTVAVIQARMGSSRLPGKVLLPLAGEHVLTHDVRRVRSAETIDKVVVATSTKTADDIIEQLGTEHEVATYRGSEVNVQKRMFEAATVHDADTVIRVTADCPLISPDTIDTVVSRLHDTSADYVSNTIDRTFPRGLDVEAFSYESFNQVVSEATTRAEREHVTQYYHNHPDRFELQNVSSDAVFDDEQYRDRSDLRLTLDEAADYRLLKRLYRELSFAETLPIRDAIDRIDANGLAALNESVEQKSV